MSFLIFGIHILIPSVDTLGWGYKDDHRGKIQSLIVNEKWGQMCFHSHFLIQGRLLSYVTTAFIFA